MTNGIDAMSAFKLLKTGMNRTDLVKIIAGSCNQQIKVQSLTMLNLNQSERDIILSNERDWRLMVSLIQKSALSYDEKITILTKSNSPSFVLEYLNISQIITDEEETQIIRVLTTCDIYNIINVFKSGSYKKLSKAGIKKLKEKLLKDDATKYIQILPNEKDRTIAFASIIKHANSSYNFLIHGNPTKEERKQVLERVALSKTYLRQILNSYKCCLTNHDKKVMAQAISNSGNIKLAEILHDGCGEQNIRYIIEHLMTAKKLANI